MSNGLRRLLYALLAAWVLGAVPARAGDGHTGWSATVYGGPAVTNRFSDTIEGKFRVTGAMAGFAVDRDIVNLGWDISLAAEAQLTHYVFKDSYTTAAIGIGLRFHDFLRKGDSLAIYTGPSYALNSAVFVTPSGRVRTMKRFLNYVSIEFAVPIPHHEQHWDAVLRIYHRSGAWGVYSLNVDEGSMVGLGIRAKF